MDDSRKPDAEVEQICRLAEGPAGPALKEAVGEWLDQEYRAIRHAVEQKEKCLPASPFPLNEHSATFPGACAVLAVLHEKTEPFYLLRPDLTPGSYRHFAWGELCKDVEDLSPRHIRNLLGYVRAELQNRGVALPSDEESPPPPPAAEGDVAAEGGTAQTESTATGPEVAWLPDFLKKIRGELARMKPTPREEEGYVWYSSTELGTFCGVSARTARRWLRTDRTLTVHDESGQRYKLNREEVNMRKEAEAKKRAKRKKRAESQ